MPTKEVSKVFPPLPLHSPARWISRPKHTHCPNAVRPRIHSRRACDYKKGTYADELWRSACTRRSRAIQTGGAKALLNSGRTTVAATNKAIELRVTAIVLLLVGSCLLMPRRADAQCTPEPTTTVRGTVYLDASDVPARAPGAKVIVWDDFTIVSAVTDREGKFRVSNLDPGTYTVEATYSGLHAEHKITVEDGADIEVMLQLKLPDPEAPPKP